jgi:hypothetical protein
MANESNISATDRESIPDEETMDLIELIMGSFAECSFERQSGDAIVALRNRIDVLECALKPFADIATKLSRAHLNNDDAGEVSGVTAGMCNAARKALSLARGDSK